MPAQIVTTTIDTMKGKKKENEEEVLGNVIHREVVKVGAAVEALLLQRKLVAGTTILTPEVRRLQHQMEVVVPVTVSEISDDTIEEVVPRVGRIKDEDLTRTIKTTGRTKDLTSVDHLRVLRT